MSIIIQYFEIFNACFFKNFITCLLRRSTTIPDQFTLKTSSIFKYVSLVDDMKGPLTVVIVLEHILKWRSEKCFFMIFVFFASKRDVQL